MAWLDPLLAEGRRRRELNDRLGDPVARIPGDRLSCRVELGIGGAVADDDAVATALVGRLEHELAQVVEHEGALVGVQAAVGRHVRDQRLLTEVVAHEVGDPGVDDLVVGDTSAGGVGDGDTARLPRPHQSGHTEPRVGQKRLGVEEQVVDAAVDHVNGLEAVDRAHEDAVVIGHDEIATFDERGAHPLSKEGVLEVRRVEDPRREHDDARVGYVLGSERHEQLGELLGVGVDGGDALAGEQLGECPFADRPILQHVTDPGRDPQVVLEHVHRAVGVTDEVGSGDVRPHAEARAHTLALGTEVGRVVEQLTREHAVGDDALVVVDVVDEAIEGNEALLQPTGDAPPLGRLDDTGDDVERPRPVDAAAIVVDGERDAHRLDVGGCGGLATPQLVQLEPVEEGDQPRRRRARAHRRSQSSSHGAGRDVIDGDYARVRCP